MNTWIFSVLILVGLFLGASCASELRHGGYLDRFNASSTEGSSLASVGGKGSDLARHVTQNGPFSLMLGSGDGNSTIEEQMCTGSFSASYTSLRIHSIIESRVFLLPDCVYPILQQFLSIDLLRIIIRGSAAFPDPFARLGAASSSLEALTCVNVAFVNDLEQPLSGVNLDTVLTYFPKTSELTVRLSQLPGATLPALLPSRFSFFSIVECGLTGSIPSTLLTQYTSAPYLVLDFKGNNIHGPIPDDLFTGFPLGSIEILTLDFSDNILDGTISSTLFSTGMPMLQLLYLDFSSNRLFGSLNNLLASTSFSSSLTTFQVRFDDNLLEGSLPTWFMTGSTVCNHCCSSVYLFEISASENNLNGSIFPGFLAQAGFDASSLSSSFILNFGQNKLAGSVPGDLLNLNGASPNTYSVDLQQNQLAERLPSNLFAPVIWTSISSGFIHLGNNQLEGDLPDSIFYGQEAPSLASLRIILYGNRRMKGSVPAAFLTSLASAGHAPSTSPMMLFTLTLATTPITGHLAIPSGLDGPRDLRLTILAAACNFTTISVAPGASRSMERLELQGNLLLSGTIPTDLFAPWSNLSALVASNTKLSGPFSVNASSLPSTLSSLWLASTDVDFCSGTIGEPWAPSKLTDCNLDLTNAYLCSNKYPKCSTLALLPTMPVSQPPSAAPSGCSEATKPSPEFVCIGSIWTFIGSYEAPTLVIPSGSTSTIIVGNVTSPSVVINGIGSSLVINNGCATNLSTVTLELTQSDLEKLGSKTKTQTLVRLNTTTSTDGTCSDLSNVNIELKVRGSSCKRVKVSKLSSNSQLSAVLSIDNRSCRTWWIVLIAVVGSVVVIVVLIVLLVVLVPSIRAFVRPFSQRNKANAATDNVK